MASAVLTDGRWVARGAERTSLPRFLLWLAPWAALLALGVYAAGLCLYYGLNQTNMDNRFAFGLWIFLDLGIIALGAGAFITGFLVYILKRAELKPILNTAVVVGFICYRQCGSRCLKRGHGRCGSARRNCSQIQERSVLPLR